jgi:hypothetical protein
MNIILSNVNCVTNKLLWAPKDAFCLDNPKNIPEPYWYRQRHPHVYFYFYNLINTIETTYIKDSYIYSNNFDNVISFLLKKFNVNYIYHTISDYYVNFNSYFNMLITHTYPKDILINMNSNQSFLYDNFNKNYYKCNIGICLKDVKELLDPPVNRKGPWPSPYVEGIVDNIKNKYTYIIPKLHEHELGKHQSATDERDPKKWEINQKYCQIKSKYVRPLKSMICEKNHYQLISLGGWCGPAVSLQQLKIRKEAMPFDYMHASLRSINYIVRGYSQYFFDPKLTIFPHHDTSKSEVKEDMYRRIQRFLGNLKDDKPILFIRSVTNIDYQYEVNQIKEFLNLIKNKYSRDCDKVLLILHSQNIGTMKLNLINRNIMLTCVEGTVGWCIPNRNNIQRNYNKLIEYALDENSWNDQLLVNNHKIIPHTEKEWEKIKNM